MAGYWTQNLQTRLSRRHLLAASGAGAAGALLLAACGGGSSSSSSEAKNKSGLLQQATDTSKQAVPGGVWVTTESEAINLDPIAQNSSTGFNLTMPVYSKLAKYGMGHDLQRPLTKDITGDAFESWELAPDATQVTLKLRPNHKFDPRPPTNGRAMTMADVKWSWDRFVAGSAFRGELLNSLSAIGMFESVSFPDDRTLVIKLAFPYAQILDVLAYYPYFNIMPVEAEDKFDPKNTMRGSGPFRLKEYVPTVRYSYEKNADWYVKGRPFLDGMEKLILPDYVAALAQFETKALWTYAVKGQDILRLKESHPQMVLQRNIDLIKAPQFAFWTFSTRPGPFRDARIRRAASMLLDRELYIETEENLKSFRDAGLPADPLWNSHQHAGQPNWIDPRTNAKDLGEGGQYFQFNPAEAKKMIAAAGFTSVKVPISYRANTAGAETFAGMLREGGLFELAVNIIPEATHRDYQASLGSGFDGLWIQTNGGHNEEAWFVNMYTPAGKFSISKEPIPLITDEVIKTRRELDENKRAAMLKQVQRDLAMDMTAIVAPGYTLGFTLNWPWLKNYGAFTHGDLTATWSSSRLYTEYWYDKAAQA